MMSMKNDIIGEENISESFVSSISLAFSAGTEANFSRFFCSMGIENDVIPCRKNITAADIQTAIDDAPENAGKTATDLSTVKPEANATFYTASVVFLSESTLKIVFKVPGGSTITGYDGSQKNTYYWVQETDIAAAQLDTLQEFTVGDATFYYSALDYAKVVLNNGNAAAQDLVSALYLYNQAANGYFGANA